ncbi:MAG: bifunctional riboflavin kinase/FAD synthetase [Nitrospinota bacterium]|nr:bifunctional riboflavin kinase/FAD synthetase [Nitrospinota bacterium]
MDVIRGVDSMPSGDGRTVLTIGNFDGVHLAHRHICRLIREAAGERGGRSVVLTFDPHPLSIVAPERRPPLMTTLEEKLARLETQGVDMVIVQPFTAELAGTEAGEFVRSILHEKIRTGLVFVGFNFHFGKGAAGNVALLRSEGERIGFETREIEAFMSVGQRVSSSAIRKLLLAGEVEEATRFLGGHHVIEGPVIEGDGRGRRIGVPTANVEYPPVLVPANGVYACWVRIGGRAGGLLPAVTNIGERPTFGGKKITVEAHLLEGGRDFYGERVRVEFVSRLREERKFSGPDELVRQIRADIEVGKKRLAETPQPGPAQTPS